MVNCVTVSQETDEVGLLCQILVTVHGHSACLLPLNPALPLTGRELEGGKVFIVSLCPPFIALLSVRPSTATTSTFITNECLIHQCAQRA